MAMNKKEKEQMESLRRELLEAKAFKRTDPVARDVMPPSSSLGAPELVTGFVFNDYTDRVDVACSSSISHAIGRVNGTTSQSPIRMFSTKLMALKALRYAVEQKCAKRLADIDEMIQAEESKNEMS